MKVKSNGKAGADTGSHGGNNHNQTVSKGVRVKSKVRARADESGQYGGTNHNQMVARRAR